MLDRIDIVDDVLIALRKIIRAIDLHSKKLVSKYGITGPQALVLKRIIHYGRVPSGILARDVNLSHATVTSILDRLEKHHYIARIPSKDDKRKVFIEATEDAVRIFKNAPPLLQEEFISEFRSLESWEQTQMLSTLQRMGTMMDAKNIAAAPLLETEE
ncbi:MAG: MarR family transcriptional regulator [Coxiellaceae bacterium]|nr:MarR family transcriptional regulator [Coxiellaceae bacterium]